MENNFCTRCFALEQDNSDHCHNCGAGGFIIRIPEWAVSEIRSNASWVGKRYYPNLEDIEKENELKKLRSTISVFNGRTAIQSIEDFSRWSVSQELGNNTKLTIFVSASSEAEALEKAKTLLPYVS